GDDIARPLRLAVDRVLHKADGADGVHLGVARRQSMHEADHAGGARHVALHVFHAGRRLDRYPAGVEAHALADERDRLLVALAAVPAHDDHAALVLRTLADAEERIHAELLHLGDVKYFDCDAELLEFAGAAGKL